MEFKEIVVKNRSYRRFDAGHAIPRETLVDLVDCARQVPSGANLQVLRYIVSCSPEMNDRIYGTLAWAAYLQDWPGPEPDERPTGYIVIVTPEPVGDLTRVDLGIAAQTIVLGAAARGLGGCLFMNIKHAKLRGLLSLTEETAIPLVIALGKPVEKVVLEEVGGDGSIRYYRTEDGSHHVPKRSLEEVLLRVYE
jgi:nitroreductase